MLETYIKNAIVEHAYCFGGAYDVRQINVWGDSIFPFEQYLM